MQENEYFEFLDKELFKLLYKIRDESMISEILLHRLMEKFNISTDRAWTLLIAYATQNTKNTDN